MKKTKKILILMVSILSIALLLNGCIERKKINVDIVNEFKENLKSEFSTIDYVKFYKLRDRISIKIEQNKNATEEEKIEILKEIREFSNTESIEAIEDKYYEGKRISAISVNLIEDNDEKNYVGERRNNINSKYSFNYWYNNKTDIEVNFEN